MNLTLHHFNKEARHIRVYWGLWLVLMGLDLAFQLEWLMPMTHLETGLIIPESAHLLVMIVAVVAALSCCAEDQPSRNNAFIATRPLPRSSYYLARALLIAVMLVVPLILQEALYLALSHRPWQAVARGMAWRGVVAGAWLAWVVPATALWKGWVQNLLGLGAFFGGLWLCGKIANVWFPANGTVRSTDFCSTDGCLLMAWLAALLMLGFAWLHLRSEWSLPRRLVIAFAVSPVLYAAFMAFEGRASKWRATDPGRVEDLARSAHITVPQERLRLGPKATYQKRPATVFCGHIEVAGLPPDVEMIPRVACLQATQAGRARAAHLSQDDTQVPMFQWGPQFHTRSIVHALPAGTVVFPPVPKAHSNATDPMEYELGRVEPGATGFGPEPLDLQCDLECEWYEWKTIADLPLKPGNQARTDDTELSITRVLANTEGKIQAKPGTRPGAVSLHFRSLQRNADATPYLILYAPDKRTAWCLGNECYQLAHRAMDSQWQRSLCIQVAERVLSYADGAKACDITKLRLIVLQRRYLGRSQWTWQSPPIDMQAHVPGHRDWYYLRGNTPRGREVKALEERLDSLKQPGPKATSEELNGYVLDVLTAYEAMKTGAVQREQHDLVVAKLRPFAGQHLDVLLALSPSAVPDEQSPIIKLVTNLSTDAQRDFIVGHILKCDWLAIVTQAKGWGDYARQKMLPAILAQGRVEQHLRKLMLTWNDPAVMQRQLHELRFFPDARAFESLYRTPSLRPEMDRLADTLWSEVSPVVGWESVSSDPLEIALSQGRTGALDAALPWSAWAGDKSTGDDLAKARKLALATARQTGMKKPGDASLFKQFRNARADEFEYEPARRAWRKKQ